MAHKRAEIEVWGTVLFVDAAGTDGIDEGALQVGIDKVREFALHVDDVFSTYKLDSVISNLRRREISIESASEEVKDVWNLCAYAREITEGAFDPWAVAGGFDPSGLVKGWAADICAEIMLESGAKHVQINAAGDLSLRGGHFDGQEVAPWSVGVVNPEIRE